MSYPIINLPNWRILRDAKRDASGILRFFQIIHPPVDILNIARDMGINVFASYDIECDGILDFSSEDQPKIYVNANDCQHKQRFAIAHEIGHLIMHPLQIQLRDTFSKNNYKEYQANKFAIELLIPAPMLTAYIPGRDLIDLTKLFDVSSSIMSKRLLELNYI